MTALDLLQSVQYVTVKSKRLAPTLPILTHPASCGIVTLWLVGLARGPATSHPQRSPTTAAPLQPAFQGKSAPPGKGVGSLGTAAV
jgi:hypothetical protein